MLLLASTSDKIRLTTGSALTVDVHTSWIDNASGAITPGRTNTAITTATTTDIVASPTLSTQRNVKAISIRNKDVSSDVVTVLHTDGSIIVQLFSCTLSTGEELCFDEATGWKHFTSAGSIKFDPVPSISDAQLLANTSGGTAAPIGTGASAYLDYAFGSTAGTTLVRGNSVWAAAAPNNPYPNILYNPSMDIDQVNEGASISLATNAGQYGVDGWISIYVNASAVVTSQRVTDAPSGTTSSLKLTVSTGAAVGSGDSLSVVQRVEASNITDIAFGTASAQNLALSFWVKSSIASYTACVALRNAAGTRSYVSNITINSANTWEQKTITLTADTSGSWITSGTASGFLVSIVGAVGSTFQTSPGVWTAGNFLGTSSCTNTILSTNGATFQVTGVKLEISPIVTPFKRLAISEELIRCQRYYEKSYDIGVALGTVTNASEELFFGSGNAAHQCGKSFWFRATKRAVPTMTFYSVATGASGKARDAVAAADVTCSLNAAGEQGASWFVTTSATDVNVQLHWTADARL